MAHKREPLDRRTMLRAGGLMAIAPAVAGVLPGANHPAAATSDALFDKGGAVHNVLADGYHVTTDGRDASAALAALATAVAERGGGTLLFPRGTYTIGRSLTIPEAIDIALLRNAVLSPSAGATLTIEGTITAGPYRVFAGAGTVNLLPSKISTVLAEWWGAVATMTGAPVDSTPAVQAALGSRRNVVLQRGVYGVRSTRLMANGQSLAGQGTWVDNSDPAGGTKILRLSGAEPAVVIGNYMGQQVRDLTIDGGRASRGDLLRDTGKNTLVTNVRLQRALDGYCLHVVGTNLCHYSDLYFPDTLHGRVERSFGHIRCENALYSTFSRCSSGMVSGGSNVRISGSTALTFDGLYADPFGAAPGIHLTGSNRDIAFDGVNVESANSAAPIVLIDATSSDMRAIRFRNVRVLQTSATPAPVFRLIGGGLLSQFLLDGFFLEDGVSRERTLIVLDGVRNSRFDNAEIDHAHPFVFIRCDGTRSDGIRSSNTAARGAGAGTNRWKCSGLFVDTSGFRQTFLPGNDFATLVNVSAPVDGANVGPGGGVALGGGGVSDPSGDFALIAGNGSLALKVFQQPDQPALADGGIALWLRTPDNTLFLVTRIGRRVRTLPLH